VLKKIGPVIGGVLLVSGIAGVFVRSFLGSGRLEHGAMDAAPIVPVGLGLLILAVVGENFTWARTEIPMPMWLGRLLFAIVGNFFLFSAWGIWHQ